MENNHIFRQAFNMLCNNKIGSGMSRQVYDSLILPDFVIKVENEAGQFQNIMEWEIWNRVKDTDYSIWFAPCRWISADGSILIMEKTESCRKKHYPEKMPVFFTDFKFANYGWIGD